MLHTLHDGTRVRLRAIRPDDRGRLAASHLRLSDETARRRYLGAKPELSAPELRYFTEVDGVTHVALVALLEDDPDVIVGVGRFVRPSPGADSAEIAFVVWDDVQGLGLGSLLGFALADEARRLGVRRFTATLFSENLAIRHLLRRISDRLEGERVEAGVSEMVVALAA